MHLKMSKAFIVGLLSLFSVRTAAAQAQLSLTCLYNNGPKAGQKQSFAGVPGVAPIPVGTACTDGQGSTGTAVADSLAPKNLSLTCKYTSGPKAGQKQSFAGVAGVTPVPVGSPCWDGGQNRGVAVPDSGGAQAPTSGLSLTCKYNTGPKAGQTQSFQGVPGVQAIPVGAPCTDGVANFGVAVPDQPTGKP